MEPALAEPNYTAKSRRRHYDAARLAFHFDSYILYFAI